MKLLVLTPTLGTSSYLGETLRSVAGLGAAVRHVLVCPPVMQDELRRRAPSAEIIADTGAGVYAALNRGLQVGGEWDAFWQRQPGRAPASVRRWEHCRYR